MTSVLIVDDEWAIADALAVLLGEMGFDTRTASNGREALRAIAEQRPDCVIIDVMMPVMDGPALLEALRGDEKLQSLCVVMMSAAPKLGTAGAYLGEIFVQKPFTVRAVVDAINMSLAGKNH